ncbi:MAG: hypothetical protein F6K39_36055 [Okeania sp. SIO3B3]|nr:hypothetical protein [Okeania sp. SIO3B3]
MLVQLLVYKGRRKKEEGRGERGEGRSFMVYLPFLSDFIPFAKSNLIAEGTRKKFYGLSSVFI